MPKQRITHNDSELQAYSKEHIWYEVRMFFGAGSNAPFDHSPQLEVQDDALLESFVLHLRNLVNFFYPPKHIKADDAIAAEHFDSGEMPSVLLTNMLSTARERANKELSHLTWKRLAGHHAAKGWDFAALMRDMANAIEAFITMASPQKLDPDFVAGMKETITRFQISP